MKLVYRIQYKRRDPDVVRGFSAITLGLYTSCMAPENLFELDGPHPAPLDDAPIRAQIDRDDCLMHYYRFGFASLDQLSFWVYKDEWRRELEDEGYCVDVFRVSDDAPEEAMVVGRTQVIFNPQYAEIVETIALSDV